LREQIIKNSIIFYLFKLDKQFAQNLGINFEDIIHLNDFYKNPSLYFSSRQSNSENIIKLSEALSKLGWQYLKVDEQIILLIETCFWDRETFREKKNILEKEENRRQELRRIYEKYYNTFRANENEIHHDIDSFLKKHLDLDINEIEKLKNLAEAVSYDISFYKKLILEKYALSEDINLLIQDKEMFLDFPEIRENVEARITDFYSKLNIDAVMCEVLERGASLAACRRNNFLPHEDM
jgi:hypothetical protein